jgi:hypothetical protein
MAIVVLVSPPAPAIVGGVYDEGNDFPNVCGIVAPSVEDHSKLIVVGSGTLIHPRVVLTAGHVTRDLENALKAGMPLEALRVSFSPDAFDRRGWLAVSAVVTHPDYGTDAVTNSIRNDIGVLILDRPVKGIQPVTLAPVGLLDFLFKTGQLRDGDRDEEFTIAGYGNGREFSPPNPIERDGLRRFARCEFAALSSKWLTLSQNPGSEGGGLASGDSGGPAFWVDPDTGYRVQVAVTSWASVTRVGDGFYWRMDLMESHDFIDWILANLDD